MGFFDWVGNIVSDATQQVVDTAETLVTHPIESFEQGTAAISAIMSHPIVAATQGLQAAEQTEQKTNVYENIANIASTGLLAAGAVASGGEALGLTVPESIGARAVTATKAVTSAAQAYPKTAALAAAVPLVAVPLLSQSPKAVNALWNLPGSIQSAATDVGKTIQDPSVSNVTSLIKNHPGLDVAALAATGYVSGTALNTFATFMNTRATNKNTDGTPSDSPSPSVVGTSPPTVQTPQTVQSVDNTPGTPTAGNYDDGAPAVSSAATHKAYKASHTKKVTHGRRKSTRRHRKSSRPRTHSRKRSSHRRKSSHRRGNRNRSRSRSRRRH